MRKRLSDTSPIIVGLCGLAGTGKTSVARGFVPLANATEILFDENLEGRNNVRLVLDHLFFAMPLYEMASIKTKTSGEFEKDRVRYALHDVLSDLFGKSPLYGAPPYCELVELVEWVADLPIEPEEYKPRTFLQRAGMMCREYNKEAFVKWCDRKIKLNAAPYLEEEIPHLTFLSDMRMENEAEWVASQPNGVIVKYTASDDVRFDRLERRDGTLMTPEQRAHVSEREVESIVPHIEIDTTHLDIEAQAKETTAAINDFFDTALF